MTKHNMIFTVVAIIYKTTSNAFPHIWTYWDIKFKNPQHPNLI